MKSDIEWIQELIEKAKDRELGINSINYYYALKHLLELVCRGSQTERQETENLLCGGSTPPLGTNI